VIRGWDGVAGDIDRSAAVAMEDTHTRTEARNRMTQPAKSQEPSMEEILASIRRIIADDDATKTSQRAAEPPKPAAPTAAPPRPPSPPPQPAVDFHAVPSGGIEDSADILDLTESMAAPSFDPPQAANAAPPFHRIDGISDVGFEEAEQKPPMLNHAPIFGDRGDENGLLSSTTSAAVDSAFNTLAQTVLVQNARTLEDLVREMLRPMLKSWLDDNLPGMVERLVRAEIERVARGR
jgi:cell pole-organizing protein PopZ